MAARFGDIDGLPVKPEIDMTVALDPSTRNGGEAAARRRTASVLGLAHYLPAEVVSNGPIAERVGSRP
jgi:hypothetical protein